MVSNNAVIKRFLLLFGFYLFCSYIVKLMVMLTNGSKFAFVTATGGIASFNDYLLLRIGYFLG
jgi:hypothetical protein